LVVDAAAELAVRRAGRRTRRVELVDAEARSGRAVDQALPEFALQQHALARRKRGLMVMS